MAGQTTPAAALPIAEADVRTLAAKLKGLQALLTPPEQTLLRLVLQRAAAGAEAPDSPAAARGCRWMPSFNPFTYLDAIAGDAAAPQTPLVHTPGRPPCGS